jgi:Holliday junction resolvase RusA-like endonuclease
MQETDDSTSLEDLQALSQTIFGEPASKANSRKIVRYGGVSRIIKSAKALNYVDLFKSQIKPMLRPLVCDVVVSVHVFYASRRPDLDESLILDLLQGNLYLNDRQVKEKHIYWHLDKECPRTYIEVKKCPPPSANGRGPRVPKEAKPSTRAASKD